MSLTVAQVKAAVKKLKNLLETEWTQSGLADKLGVSQAYISLIANEKAKLSEAFHKKLQKL